ncbi:hypothetical protein CRG98_036084 [Punica granatum]|uniref:Uncharacterized protein n=1 Tax=Punica granatum TaxID=22663 RepID=A0A2I0IJK6_PUNGR|nr:hypothetical protein CRG98_036084 [Punica granatum]
METPSSFLELSTMEMAEGQKFEDYATNWRSKAAKHFPPICEAQQIQMFHGTLKGAYYSHLMGHKSTFSEMIMAGKQVDLGIKLGRLEGPTKKGEGESSRKTAAAVAPTNGRGGKDASINAVNLGHPGSQQYSVNFTPAPPATPAYAPPTVHYPSQHPAQPVYYLAPPTAFPSAPQQVVHHYAPAPSQTPQYRPPASRTPQPTQQAPAPQGKGKAPAASGAAPEAPLIPQKKVTEEEAEAFMKVIKASEYKVPKETAPGRIEETVSSIFSNAISFSDDELPSEGWAHSRALHIVCKCNNFIIGRVMIDNGSALNVCPVSTLKQMNVDLNRDEPVDLSAICAVTEETPSGVHIRLAQENEELNNWTSVSCYSVVIADV